MRMNDLTEEVIGAAIEVHRELGPGLLENAYEECLCHELNLRGLKFERQVSLPVRYKSISLDCGYRMDIVVEGRLILELKTVDKIAAIHDAQILTYLKLSRLGMGLILNFSAATMVQGVRRVANGYEHEMEQN